MRLLDVVRRRPVPEPWTEGDKIPWSDPEFSGRMLAEHLSQAHDAASRRSATIDAQIAWIHGAVLSGRPTRILDLGCGPGLYTSRLARLGHTCAGIDYAPASIAYARSEAERAGLNCTYALEDIRTAEYGNGHDLVMLIYGEFNVFRPSDARLILKKACRALDAEGMLLLEPHTFEAVRKLGAQPPSWYSTPSGLFSDQPHLVLHESFWDADRRVTTERYYVVDAAGGGVERYAASMQAYTDDEYRALLHECGFDEIRLYPSLRGTADESQPGLFAAVARKAAAGPREV